MQRTRLHGEHQFVWVLLEWGPGTDSVAEVRLIGTKVSSRIDGTNMNLQTICEPPTPAVREMRTRMRNRRLLPSLEVRDWMTPSETALVLGCSVATVHPLRRGIPEIERVPFSQYGGKIVFGNYPLPNGGSGMREAGWRRDTVNSYTWRPACIPRCRKNDVRVPKGTSQADVSKFMPMNPPSHYSAVDASWWT